MFDNPEKLMILLVIALLILGPSRLAGFGGTLGRAMRDFRNAVRGAQEDARSAFSEFTQEASSAMHDVQQALPAPDAFTDNSFMNSGGEPEAVEQRSEVPAPVAAAPPAESGAGATEEDLSSLASEPTAAVLREVTRQAQHTSG